MGIEKVRSVRALRRVRAGGWRFSAAGAIALLSLAVGVPVASASLRANASHSPYVFGMTYAESGPLAPYSYGASQFVNAYFKDIDAHGGIDGHPLKVITLDDAGDPGKSLLNVETLWSQDHVLGLVYPGTITPWTYIKQNNVPVWTFSPGTGSRGFGSAYPTYFPTGSVGAIWDSQAAYWSVKIEHKHPKVVGVLFNTGFSTWNDFVLNYWHKLGAQTVYLDAGSGSGSTDCTALVLKWKSEGVQYLDWQDNEWPSCLLAEQRLGWKPPLGQGSPSTSQPGEAELLGKAIVGVIAGSPNAQYTGAPIFDHPNTDSKTYEGDIAKYARPFANYAYLNSTGVMADYESAILVADVVKATLAKYHKVTSALMMKVTGQMRNWDGFTLDPPVASFSPTCKTGGDGTIWGYWHFNPHPTAIKPAIYMIPTSGHQWVNTRAFLGLSKCYLTQLTDKLFPNG
jgi:hypothetical protein